MTVDRESANQSSGPADEDAGRKRSGGFGNPVGDAAMSAIGRMAQVLGQLGRHRHVSRSQAEVDRAAGRLTTLVGMVVDPISVAVDKVSRAGARALERRSQNQDGI